ncbi:MAG TPA: C-GCAxxG-C-C family protein [Leptolinea sp.]
MEDIERMRELRQQGFYCSQILLIMGLELQGKNNPDLVGAVHGLAGGLGFNGELCGGLTGGACLLGLYAGRKNAGDEEDPRLDFMIEDLVKWFKSTVGEKYGGCKCDDIIGDQPGNQASRCPVIVAGTFQKVKDLLVENGFDLTGNPDF